MLSSSPSCMVSNFVVHTPKVDFRREEVSQSCKSMNYN
jgi:hypothetical protein